MTPHEAFLDTVKAGDLAAVQAALATAPKLAAARNDEGKTSHDLAREDLAREG